MTRLRGAFPPVVSAAASTDPVIQYQPAPVAALVASEPRTAAGRSLEEQQG